MTAILFLCHGNICRSPMAEFVMKDKLARAGLADKVQVESAALHTDEIGSDIHRGTRAILETYGIPFTPREAHLAKQSDYDRFDYIRSLVYGRFRDYLRRCGCGLYRTARARETLDTFVAFALRSFPFQAALAVRPSSNPQVMVRFVAFVNFFLKNAWHMPMMVLNR